MKQNILKIINQFEMGKFFIIAVAIFLHSTLVYSQQEKLEIEGAIQISNSEDPTPDPGTIRFNSVTNDFEGWNGEWISLTRLQDPIGSDEVIDIDGNRYLTVTVGTQIWMRENLRTSRYQNGDSIPEIILYSDWAASSNGAWCWYDNSHFNDTPYGKLYNWYAIEDSRNLCPVGWHLPVNSELTTLSDFFGGAVVAGGKLKEIGLAHWNAPNAAASNRGGITDLPGGYRHSDGTFHGIGIYSDWWTKTVHSTDSAWYHETYHDDQNVNIYATEKVYGFSVRCIKD